MKDFKEIRTADGVNLFARSWTVDDPIAVVYFHHGLGEHVDRYTRMFTKFNEAGIQVCCFDARGHGQTLKRNTGMAMGHIGTWESILADIKLLTQTFPADKPSYLMGHSMGGLIVLQYALQKQSNLEFAGIICCSPAIKNASPIHPVKYWGGRLLAPLLPKICVKSGLDFTNISSIPEIVQEYKNDPLVHPYISLGTAKMLLDIGEQIARQTSPIINGNVLIAHGDCDKITSFEASKRFFDRLAVPKHCAKESLFIENGCHELHNDLCADEVINRYINWILTRRS